MKFIIEYFNGGISDLSNRGVRGAFQYGKNIDLRGKRPSLKGNQKLKKVSGSTVKDLILFFVPTTNGKLYGFGDSGRIYKTDITTGDTQEVYNQGEKILGAAEYWHNDGNDNYVSHIVFATKDKLYETKDEFQNVTEVGEFERKNENEFHTMKRGLGVLLITDSDYIAMLDYEGAFNNKALDLPHGIHAKDLREYGNLVAIGATEIGEEGLGYMFTWDKLNYSWIQKKSTGAEGVNSLNFLESGILIQTGEELKYWDTVTLIPLKQFPEGAYSLPGASSHYKSIAMLGINGMERGNGVYGYGRRDKNSPYALNLEFTPSHGNDNPNVKIGAIANVKGKLFVSWFDGVSEYGIDTIDKTKKSDYEWESLELTLVDAITKAETKHIKITTRPLPENTRVQLYYRSNRSNEWKRARMNNGDDEMKHTGQTEGIFSIADEMSILELKVLGFSYENETPEIINLGTIHYDTKMN